MISKTSQVAWLFAGGAAAHLTTLLLNILLARFLGQAEYGTYRQLLLVHGLVAPIFTIALPASVLYFLAREHTSEGRKRFVTQTVLLLGSLGVVTSGVMFGGASFFSKYFSNPDLYSYLRIFAVYSAFMLTSSFLSPVMVAIGKAKLSALYAVSIAIIRVGLVLLAVLIRGDLAAITMAIVLSALLDLLLALGLTAKVLGFASIERIKLSVYWAQLAYSAPLGLAAIVNTWGLRIDQFWISTLFNPSTYAIYAVGAMEVPFIRLLQGNVNSVLLPAVTRLYQEGDKASVIKLWQTAIDRTSLVMFPAFFLLMLTSQDLIILLFSEKYLASVTIFRIYLLTIPLRLVTFGLLLRAAGKTKYDFWGSLVALTTNAALGFFLVKLIGIPGPAWSKVFSLLALITYLSIMTAKQLQFKARELIPAKVILKHILIPGLSSLIVLAIDAAFLDKLIPQTPIFRLCATSTLFLGLYLLLLYMISPPDFKVLIGWVRLGRAELLTGKGISISDKLRHKKRD